MSGSTFSSDGSLTTDVDDFGGALLNGYNAGSDSTATISDSSFYDDDSYFDGGAIDNGDDAGTGTLTVTGSTFYGDATEQTATPDGGYGGAIDNGDTTQSAGTGTLTVLGSTLAEDSVDGASQLINNDTADGVTVAGDIFDGSCTEDGSGGLTSNATDGGYNVSTDGTCTSSGSGDVTAATAADLNLGAPASGNSYTLEPTFPSPVIGVIPDATTVFSSQLCPATDILGNSGPVFQDDCNAGAIQAATLSAPAASATGVAATAGVGDAAVSWTPPSLADAGGQISDFTVTPYNVTTGSDGAPTTTGGDTDSLTISGLTDGDSYTFTVVTNNTVGSGPASAASSADHCAVADQHRHDPDDNPDDSDADDVDAHHNDAHGHGAGQDDHDHNGDG